MGARPLANWLMAAAKPDDALMHAFAEAYLKNMLDYLERSTHHDLPYFIFHCSITQLRIHNPSVEERWQRIRANAAKHPLPDPTGLGGTSCECDWNAHHERKSCIPAFAEDHCYVVKKPT